MPTDGYPTLLAATTAARERWASVIYPPPGRVTLGSLLASALASYTDPVVVFVDSYRGRVIVTPDSDTKDNLRFLVAAREMVISGAGSAAVNGVYTKVGPWLAVNESFEVWQNANGIQYGFDTQSLNSVICNADTYAENYYQWNGEQGATPRPLCNDWQLGALGVEPLPTMSWQAGAQVPACIYTPANVEVGKLACQWNAVNDTGIATLSDLALPQLSKRTVSALVQRALGATPYGVALIDQDNGLVAVWSGFTASETAAGLTLGEDSVAVEFAPVVTALVFEGGAT